MTRRPTYEELLGAARRLGELSAAAREGARGGKDAVAARRRAQLPVRDGERDDVVDLLNASFARGLLDDDDRERRVGIALAAHTEGELARAVEGLPLTRPVRPVPSRAAAVAAEVRQTLKMIAFVALALIGLVVAVAVLIVVIALT